MKISIYELLGLIKDGKAPNRIKYGGYTYWFCVTAYHRENGGNLCGNYLGEDFKLDLCLNDEVEILDEPKKDKKIIKIKEENGWCGKQSTGNEIILKMKVNELIDEVNKLKEKK